MKRHLLFTFLVIAISLTGISELKSQVNLLPVFTVPALPDLEARQLIRIDTLVSFKHNEGIIIYYPDQDVWRLHGYLDNFEQYGMIKDIRKLNNTFIISCTLGGIVITGSKIKALDKRFSEPVEYNGHVLIFARDLFPEEDEGYYADEEYTFADHLLDYDPVTCSFDTIILSKTITNPRSCVVQNDLIWVFANTFHPESWVPDIWQVGLNGEVTSAGIKGLENHWDFPLFTINNEIIALGDSGVYTITSQEFPKKIMDLERLNLNTFQKSGSGIYILPARHRSFNKEIEISYADVREKSVRKITIPLIQHVHRFVSDNPSDYFIFRDKLFQFREALQIVYCYSMDSPYKQKYYSIRDGISSSIENMAEDDKEAWFVTQNSVIHRYSKKKSSWTTYTDYIDYAKDSNEIRNCFRLTLNKDYVFFPFSNELKGPIKILLFNRRKESFKVLSKEEFVAKFIYNGSDFINYKGEKMVNDNRPNFLPDIPIYGDAWNFFLFLYDLPLSGNNSGEDNNVIVKESRGSILSFFSNSNKRWINGIIFRQKDSLNILFLVEPRNVENFESFSVPHMIGGQLYRVFAASSGNSCAGVLIYDLSTLKCYTKPELFNELKNISFLYNTGQYILAGSYQKRLHAVDIRTFEITNLSEFINGTPRNARATHNYVYVATEHGLIYFDHKLKFQGKLFPEPCILTKTHQGLYLISGEKVFLINESNN